MASHVTDFSLTPSVSQNTIALTVGLQMTKCHIADILQTEAATVDLLDLRSSENGLKGCYSAL